MSAVGLISVQYFTQPAEFSYYQMNVVDLVRFTLIAKQEKLIFSIFTCYLFFEVHIVS